MKFKQYIIPGVLSLALAAALPSCSPDDYDMGSQTYTAATLVSGQNYTITVVGNVVYLSTTIEGCTPLWTTPSGYSQEKELSVALAFAGEYEFTFGVITGAGAVYDDPQTVVIEQNDFSLVANDFYTYLAGGVDEDGNVNDPITWVPCDGDYGVGQCTGPVMYMNPDDVKNDGTGITDIVFGSDNWAPNWDPGFQSWLVPEDDPYMDSYMTFGLSEKDGCTLEMYRGESGTKGASSGSNLSGKFTLNVDDAKHPTITFTNTYVLHNIGFDDVCDNYTKDIKIIELTPYVLQFATMRTNSEGSWWIVWNFINKKVQTGELEVPADDAGTLSTAAVSLPTFSDLATSLFTTDINGVSYVGSEMTYTIDEEKPYDFLWWNGATSTWDEVIAGSYNDTWAPAASGFDDFEFIIDKKSDGTYTWEDASGNKGTFTITDDSKISFFTSAGIPTDVTFVTASSDSRTIEVTGSEFTVLKNTAAESLTLGIPYSTDENGDTNSYLVVNLAYKAVVSSTGPTTVKFETDYSNHMWIENGCIRLAFWSYGSTGEGIFSDVSSVKVKNNETITVVFKLTGGITWSTTPKCALIDNNIKTTWETGCFDLDDAVTLNTSGETSVSLTNNTGSTVKFVDTCLDLSIQYTGYGVADSNAGDSDLTPLWDTLDFEVVSITIQ